MEYGDIFKAIIKSQPEEYLYTHPEICKNGVCLGKLKDNKWEWNLNELIKRNEKELSRVYSIIGCK